MSQRYECLWVEATTLGLLRVLLIGELGIKSLKKSNKLTLYGLK